MKGEPTVATRLAPIDQSSRWDHDKARHLLNRAGFGIPLSKVDEMVQVGPERCVDALVNYEQYPDNLDAPDFITPRSDYRDYRDMMLDAADDADERRKVYAQVRSRQRAEVERLKRWWLNQMAVTTRPLQEKMALLWHSHFATSAKDIKDPKYNYDINQVFRTNATGNFRKLVFEVGKTPAMLNYLNNKQNRKGKPNENWARELMELFTMGIGNYTEDDIKEAARAFTGYTEINGTFQFQERQHDFGEKTFLGQKGDFDGADIVNIIMEQPETARFISHKIWEYLVYENPDEELVEELAGVLRANNYELKPLLAAIFMSQEFYGAKAMQGQIKSPAQYLVMVMDQLRLKTSDMRLASVALRGLGQDLFYPPNVKGWPGNRTWINTNTLLLRYNIPAYVLMGERAPGGRALDLDEVAMGSMMGMEGMEDMSMTEGPRSRRRQRPEGNSGVAYNKKRPVMDVKKFFAKYYGKPGDVVVEQVSKEFVGRSLEPQQLKILASALVGGQNTRAIFDSDSFDNKRAAATLHLLLSTPEYQLC